ncbi:PTS galactitol transporter subunit IIC [Clostridium sediminicola]|uniref:PTS galactitol transporter subunit IIC n=1 Tax=Clostridium sediminicola TaxID=3114879 RepID=UPI0031F1EFBB
MLNILSRGLELLLSFESYVMLPILMMIISLIIGLSWQKTFKSCLTLGIGFIGIFITFDHFVEHLGPVLDIIVKKTGMALNVLDVGWPPLAGITWSFEYVPLLLVVIMATNVVMFLTKWTKTVNIDIWNYWHFMLIAQILYGVTGNIYLSICAAVFAVIIIMRIADWSASDVGKFTGLEGVSITTLPCVCYYPIGILGDRLLQKIPFINKIKADPDTIKDKLGFFGDPMFVGFTMGTVLGIVAKYSLKDTLELAFNISAVVYILPKMTKILGDGLLPISSGMKEYMMKRFPKMKNSYIGLHFAVLLGDSAVIVTGILLMPAALILALILPGVRFLPLGSLPNMIGAIPMIVVACRRNVVKSFIIGLFVVTGHLYVASGMAEIYTNLAAGVNYTISGYDGIITSFLEGGNLMRYWIMELFTGNTWGILLTPVVLFLLYYTKKKCEAYE